MVITGETSAGVPVTSGNRGREKLLPRIAVLDGYRALAIYLVLFYHYTVRWALPQDPVPHLPPGRVFAGFAPFEYGWFGVEFFFVISGFVILMTLARCRNLADFALRRFARLWPAMAVAAGLTALAMFLIGPGDWQVGRYDYLTSILFLSPNITSALLHGADVKWADGAYWSLWVEVRFYILALIFYWAFGRNFIKAWLALFFAAPVLSHVSAVVAVPFLTPRGIDLFCFPKYLPYFTLGICLYEIYSSGAQKKWAWTGAAMAACQILYDAIFTRNIFIGSDPLICVIIVLAMVVLLLLFLADSPWLAIFRFRPVVILGQASYSLYLIHENIGVALMRRVVDLGLPYFLVLPLTIAAVTATSLLMFRTVELPAKSWILRHSRTLVTGLDRTVPLARL